MGTITLECVADDSNVIINGIVFTKDSQVRPRDARSGRAPPPPPPPRTHGHSRRASSRGCVRRPGRAGGLVAGGLEALDALPWPGHPEPRGGAATSLRTLAHAGATDPVDGLCARPRPCAVSQRLQELWSDYLAERGIDEDMAEFIPAYIDLKENKEYLRWLTNLQKFTSK